MYDVIVIGAGVMGSATAYHLAGSGRQTLLLEQFTVGHTRGSSHGGSRIIRYTHREVDDARIMPAVFALWRELEAESSESLLKMTGGLYVGPEDESFMVGAQIALQTLRHPYRLMTAHELAQEFPQFRIPAGWLALYQQDSGILAATRAVQTLARQAVRRGATLREQTQVLAVTPVGDGVAVRCAGPAGAETIYAQQAVITAGPWVQRLLQPLLPAALPLQVTHQQVAYFAVEQPERYAVGRCPIFLFTAEPHFYGFPIFERPNLIKVGQERLGNGVDPDAERVIDMEAMARLSDVVAQTLVGVDPAPQQMELCLYTETPTREFIVDRHPEHPQILIGCGFSGRGFKFAIAIGRLLADLAVSPPGDCRSEFWLPKFALTRWIESRE